MKHVLGRRLSGGTASVRSHQGPKAQSCQYGRIYTVNHGTGIGKMTNYRSKPCGNREPGQRGDKANPSQRPVGRPPYAQEVERGYEESSQGAGERPEKLGRVIVKSMPGAGGVQQPAHHQEPAKRSIQDRHEALRCA
jgi:hypothetical protein